jgi:protein arginine kinase activator
VKTSMSDPASRPAPPICQTCGSARVSARVTRGTHVVAVCDACLSKALAGSQSAAPDDVARFFTLLTRPDPARTPAPTPDMPAETTCGGCGLTYEEFAEIGRTGCAQCYTAFSTAILPALHALNVA